MSIPTSENALLIQTGFANQSAWDRLIGAAREPGDIFMFNTVRRIHAALGCSWEALLGK